MANLHPGYKSKQPTNSENPKHLPGVKLMRILRPHTDFLGRIAWSPDGRTIASSSEHDTVWLWNINTGECFRLLKGSKDYGSVLSIAFDPSGHILAAGTKNNEVILWDVSNGKTLHTFKEKENAGWFSSVLFHPTKDILYYASPYRDLIILREATTGRPLKNLQNLESGSGILSIALSSTGDLLASGSANGNISVWNFAEDKTLTASERIWGQVNSVAFNGTGQLLATCHQDNTVRLWDTTHGKLRRILEGHTGPVGCISYFSRADLLASKGVRGDDSIRIWRTDTGACVAVISEEATNNIFSISSMAFHPQLPLLATVGLDSEPSNTGRRGVVRIYELDLDVLLGQTSLIQTSHYINAKAVLLGDTGVGKTALSLVLNGKPFEATDSTAGRKVWTFQSQEVKTENNVKQTRETLLWDMAGQPGYRVIHQLNLNEVAVALVVFDARSETDPLAGVRHWERALRLAQQRQGALSVPMKKFLVSARTDRGVVSVSKERVEALLGEYDFDGYFETSAKEGWQIKELRQAIEQAIPWDALPVVSSSILFADIKSFLLGVKLNGRLVAQANQLYDEFLIMRPDLAAEEPKLRAQFDTCIGRLENRDLIRRLSFGGYVLIQPELLDAYASAMVNAAKEEPDGLGSITEDVALSGQFYVPKEQKVEDRAQEQLLLHATVEELAKHDLALRESAADGRYLVFPSQFNRDYEDAPEPKGKLFGEIMLSIQKKKGDG